MLKKLLAAGMLAATIGTIPVPAVAQVYVEVAPPPLRHEVVPSHRRGHVWVPGHWVWRGYRHHWVPGHWVVARRGYRYNSPHWSERNGRWYYESGRWDRDGDGVPNRYDRRPNNPYRS